MPISTDTALQLRTRINDKAKRHAFTLYGDSTASAFEIPANAGGIVTGHGGGVPSAYVGVAAGWSATGATFNFDPAYVTFSGVISANTAVQCIYWDGVFSDAEIDYFTAIAGDINSMHLEVVKTLMMDAYKRAQWAGGGVSYNDTKTFDNLVRTHDLLWSAITVQQGPLGGFESWSDAQQEFPQSTNQNNPW